MAKVYVSCHHADPANDLAAALLAAGHAVVSTWHTDPAPRPAAGDAGAWRLNAVRNLGEIETADALVLVASAEHIARTKCVPGGKFVEAGYAMGAGVRVFTLGGVENGMLYADATNCETVADLLKQLGA